MSIDKTHILQQEIYNMDEKLIDYDFIEIGTCDFDTLVETCTDSAVGICVEPIKEYLDKLPIKKNIKKVNKAISFDNSEGYVDVYYIPENVLKENKLKLGFKGCNRIGGYHPHHIKKKITHLVETYKIEQIKIETLLKENSVRKIKHLKIDTEGGDCFILRNLISYLQTQDIIYFPEKITFETNLLTNYDFILETVEIYKNAGYRIESKNNFVDDGNTVLVRSDI